MWKCSFACQCHYGVYGYISMVLGSYVNAIKVHYPNVCIKVLSVCAVHRLHIIIMFVVHTSMFDYDWIKMMVGIFRNGTCLTTSSMIKLYPMETRKAEIYVWKISTKCKWHVYVCNLVCMSPFPSNRFLSHKWLTHTHTQPSMG